MSILEGTAYIDTNIFIYALENFPEYQSSIKSLFSAIDSGTIRAVTSELTLAEVLIKPMIDKNQVLVNTYQEVLTSSELFQVMPVNRQILIEAAKIRSNSPAITLPDAIHLATGSALNCSVFITNDKRLKSLETLEVSYLSEW